MNNLLVSPAVLVKLREKHGVSRREVEQCYENKCGTYLEDTREDHQTDPATLWFIAPTNANRQLKVVFIFIEGKVRLKTAYEPNTNEINVYEMHGK